MVAAAKYLAMPSGITLWRYSSHVINKMLRFGNIARMLSYMRGACNLAASCGGIINLSLGDVDALAR